MSTAFAEDDENKARLAALQKAARILNEHYDVGFIVVSHEEAGKTFFSKTEWGNKFAICKMGKDFADGSLDPWDDSDDDEEEL